MEKNQYTSASEKNQKYIFRPYITVNGVVHWARNHGKKAFKIPVDD